MNRDNATTLKFQKELNAGTIGLVVLCVLRRDGELYGYDLVKRMTTAEGNTLPMNQGAVYPVLRSLEKQELLQSRIQPSVAGPPRKYYRLTAKGEAAYQQWKQAWLQAAEIVSHFLKEPNDDRRSAARRAKVSGASGNRG